MNETPKTARFAAQDAGRTAAFARATPWWGNKTLVAGLLVVGSILALTLLAPLLTPHDPTQQDLNHVLEGPSSTHLLGTDQLGRDVWAQLLYGGRVDLRIALACVILPFLFGSGLGALAGYFGGSVDGVIGWAIDVFFAFPFYVLVIALVFVFGAGERAIFVAISAVAWVSYARIVRGEVLVAKQQDWMRAAQIAGLSTPRILFRHLLPNVISQAVVFATSAVVFALLAIAALGFLGLGIAPPTPDWGRMIGEGQAMLTTNWQLATLPGLAIVIAGVGFALIGDGLAAVLKVER